MATFIHPLQYFQELSDDRPSLLVVDDSRLIVDLHLISKIIFAKETPEASGAVPCDIDQEDETIDRPSLQSHPV